MISGMNDFEYFLMTLLAIGGPIVFAFGWAIRSEIAHHEKRELLARICRLRKIVKAREELK